jgi:hypothetical protein
MGMTPEQHDEQWKPPASKEPAREERGHGRGRITLHVVGGSPELRGVPLIGTGPGGLENTRPGGELGRVRRLEAEVRELMGSPTARGGARFVVQVRVSERGVLRVRRGKL